MNMELTAKMLPTRIDIKELQQQMYSMQEQVWNTILNEMRLSETDIMDDETVIHNATVNRREVKQYIHCLIKNGYAELLREEHIGNRRKNRTFRIVEKQLDAPRFNGRALLMEPYRNEDRMWRAIRMLRQFPVWKLSASADVDVDVAEKYCEALDSVMILFKWGDDYCLRNDIGGKAPLIKPLKTVFNPNAEELLIPADRRRKI